MLKAAALTLPAFLGQSGSRRLANSRIDATLSLLLPQNGFGHCFV